MKDETREKMKDETKEERRWKTREKMKHEREGKRRTLGADDNFTGGAELSCQLSSVGELNFTIQRFNYHISKMII